MSKRGIKVHELKTWEKYFDQVADLQKTFEARENDRDFQEGDILVLRKFNPVLQQYDPIEPELYFRVGSVLYGPDFGVQEGWCVMSLLEYDPTDDFPAGWEDQLYEDQLHSN